MSLEAGRGEQKFVRVRNWCLQPSGNLQSNLALRGDEYGLLPSVPRSTGKSFLWEAGEGLTTRILYRLRVRGPRMRVQNAKSVLLKLPVMEKCSLC